MRTYGSRPARSPLSALDSSSPPRPSLKRSLDDALDEPPAKKRSLTTSFRSNIAASAKPKPKAKVKSAKTPKKQLTQLHFSLDTSILISCALCDLSYTRGAPDDEALHRAHCARVQRGMEWGKEEERDRIKAGVEVVESGVRLKDGRRGRIVVFRADVGGRIGAKLTTLLETINLSLSAPALTPTVLQASKVYLFLLPNAPPLSSSSSSSREKIIGCVIAQRISAAMAVASDCPSDTSALTTTTTTIYTSPSSSLTLYPTPLPTPLGIPRLFTPSSFRRLGVASRLLTAAARTAVHGCGLDPRKGEVAFTQPTEGGRAVMEAWGQGGVRVYEE